METMKTIITICFFIISNSVFADDRSSIDIIIDDYKTFYSGNRLLRMGLVYGANAGLANTKADQSINNWFQKDVRNDTTDDISGIVKNFGEFHYVVPLTLLASSTNLFGERTAFGSWGTYSNRAFLVGVPNMLLMQNVIGGSRPVENKGSKWKPFSDNNGVSGHAFVGAVPFLTIAKMNDNLIIKSLAYVASTTAALSRINDNSHYMSQSILGWYTAWESVDAVFDNDKKHNKFNMFPLVTTDMYGVIASYRW